MTLRTSVSPEIVKALAIALAYRDFSGWNMLDGWDYHKLTFKLDIGAGYSLYAHPDPDFIAGAMDFDIMYEGTFMFCCRGEFKGIDKDDIELKGDGVWAKVMFDGTVEPHEYARSMKDFVSETHITYRSYNEEKVAGVFSSGSPYIGCDEGGQDWRQFGWEFKKALMMATFMQDFSGIERYTDESWIKEAGFEFAFRDTEEVGYSTRYRISVSMPYEYAGPVDFGFSGILTRDGDGILIRGDNAAFTIPVGEDDMRRFREETGFPTPEEYLAEHPFVSYRQCYDRHVRELAELEGRRLLHLQK